MARFVVTTGSDTTNPRDGELTLREAVEAALDTRGKDTIVFADSVNRVELGALMAIAPESGQSGNRITIRGDRNGDGLADVSIGTTSGGTDVRGDREEDAALIGIDGVDVTFDGIRFADIDVEGFGGAGGLIGDEAGADGGDGGDAPGIYMISNDNGTLTLMATTFDDISIRGVSGGSGGAGVNGRAGTNGDAGTDGANGRGGTSGGDGGDGGTGGNGALAVGTVFNMSAGTLVLTDVAMSSTVYALGGAGGRGLQGGNGGDGGDGGRGSNGLILSHGPGDGGNGGHGGDGGRGGIGGNGGAAVNGFLVQGDVRITGGIAAQLSSDGRSGFGGFAGPGGDLGDGGDGGDGGSFVTGNGADGSDGDDGDDGAAGGPGFPGTFDPFWIYDAGGPAPDYTDTLVFANGQANVVREGNDLIYTIVRLGSSDTNFTVDWGLRKPGATREADFVGDTSGTVEFTAGGADLRTVRIGTLNERTTEGHERLAFRIDNATYTSQTDETLGIGTSSVRGRIRDTDLPTSNDDRLFGTGRADTIDAGGGNDVVRGGRGADSLGGNKGRDELFGQGGADMLRGGRGNDRINGGRGGDEIEGNLGQDILTGGRGSDIFRYKMLRDSGPGRGERDWITDLGRGNDKIDLSKIDAEPLLGGNQKLAFIGTRAFDGSGGQIRHNERNDVLQIDVTGDGTPDMAIDVTGNSGIARGDFIL